MEVCVIHYTGLQIDGIKVEREEKKKQMPVAIKYFFPN